MNAIGCPRSLAALALGLILVLAPALMRLHLFWSPREGLWSPLDPDAIGYAEVAHKILIQEITSNYLLRGPFFSMVLRYSRLYLMGR